jgi:CubicO group peptidase (beta-lactamase class C family)
MDVRGTVIFRQIHRSKEAKINMKSTLAWMTVAALGLLLPTSGGSLRAEEPAAGKIAAKLQPFVDSHAMAGAVVLVATKEKVVDLEAVGFADIGAKKAMAADSMFWIASMSKAMTAAAVMMLVDEGKVNLDDPVAKYLPEFNGQMVAAYQDQTHTLLVPPVHPITVKNVLSHTAGLPFMSRVEHHIDDFPLAVATLTYAEMPLKFQPDTKFDYSNAGINTAGRIVEVVSGMPFEKFLQTRLFDPLGMKDTTFYPNAEQLSRLAKSYKPNAAKDGLEEMPVSQFGSPLDKIHNPSPGGGLFSTAADVGRFCRMLLNDGEFDGKKILSPAAVRRMTTTQTGHIMNPNGENGYGLGLFTDAMDHGLDKPATPSGHGGAYSTDMRIDPQRGLVTVWMVQHGGYAGNDGGKILPTFRQAAEEMYGKK